eukprot:CAMPEP_0175875098 /NCGR_PEP_ID=MMETSP0107_2-20121207/39267_1 /TAXON_ID=195067 ORGANISM="Goniomonas pacifica, Strain CCMP1869" /NCGR_SAMPLE_ID=MMETSP0107_2 /ASSEMBLY_ACC=CAM_ASM_000203 /LENGTH=77 /DNA_ID=CAMNT_0017194081 /DNA_START=33 /DNA_END=263 /DNA_ORIENTATION=+
MVDWFEDEKRVYIVFERTHGTLMECILHRASISERVTQGVVRSAAKALGFLHNKGWVHRDVRPDSIFLREEDHHRPD